MGPQELYALGCLCRQAYVMYVYVTIVTICDRGIDNKVQSVPYIILLLEKHVKGSLFGSEKLLSL